jgi:hypothetical protein
MGADSRHEFVLWCATQPRAGVDVDRVLSAPRRIHPIVPDALQVGGLRARARARNQKVAPELKVESRQRRIDAARIGGDALVGR